VVEASEVEGAAAHEPLRQMPLVTLPAQREDARPLRREEVHLDRRPLPFDLRTDAGYDFDGLGELLSRLRLGRAKGPGDTAESRVSRPCEQCVAISQERSEHIAEPIRVIDLYPISPQPLARPAAALPGL